MVMQLVFGAGVGALLVRFAQWPLWTAAACTVLLPMFSVLLVNTVAALVSRATGESPRMWWHSLAGEIIAGFKVFVFRQPWTTQAPEVQPATGPTPRIPVVLVHGYLCNHRIWDDVATTLRANGHTVLAVNLEPLFCSVDRYSTIVESAVNELCRHTGANRVALVGHSMGGLAIRAWMRAHGTERVGRVLTLGTPHAGTQIAPNTHTSNGKQMCWQSAWLKELAASESQTTRALIHIALTPQDNIVYPQRAQVLAGVEPVVFEGIGHVQMCLDPAVIQWTTAQLSAVPFD
jgi:triacylglycerol esterase/lipase EstA (alpha/beta hydrolase family)